MEKIIALLSSGFARLFQRSQSTLKFGFLLLLVLVLLIPLGMIERLIDERLNRRQMVVSEIQQSWSPQTITGPLLMVPYNYRIERQKNLHTIQLERRGQAFFLPERLAVSAEVLPEVRYRGVFEALVYQTVLEIEGSFAPLDLQALDIEAKDLLWQEAVLLLGVADLRGTRGVPQVQWAGRKIALSPGTTQAQLPSGAHAKLELDPKQSEAVAFALSLPLTGYGSLAIAPVGKTTSLGITSSWPHPSPHFSYSPWSARCRRADRAGKPCSAMQDIGQAA